MLCPVCKTTTLVMTTRNEVEIDYCPSCRGVWLDRGELDKIIERSNHLHTHHDDARPHAPEQRRHDDEHGRYGHYDDDRHKHHPHKKKKSYWSDLFDFD
jgi:Zn-finger nucleic acid-binding protein